MAQTYDFKTVAIVAVVAVIVGGLIGAFSAPQTTGAAGNTRSQGYKCENIVSEVGTVTKCYQTIAENTKFPVTATGAPGWQTCNQHTGGIKAADAYCWVLGYNGIDISESPCFYEEVTVDRYDTNEYLTTQLTGKKGPGLALTQVICRAAN